MTQIAYAFKRSKKTQRRRAPFARWLLVLLSFSAVISCLFAQSNAIIQGRVTDKTTGTPLPACNVVVAGTKWGTATDTSGFYRLEGIPIGRYSVRAAMIGYETVTVDSVVLEAAKVHNLDIKLEAKPIELEEVKIEAERLWEKYETDVSLIGVQRMTQQEITSLPGAFDDPTRAVLIRSGATGAGDYSSFLTVRGSSPEQNLVVMDEVVIPNPYRFRMVMGGGMSIFDAKTVEDVHLHLGAFTAAYGNAMASVLEVKTRTGNLERFKFGGAVNLTDAGAVVEGPISKGKLSVLLSGRRTYMDVVADRIDPHGNTVYPFYYDFSNKWLLRPNERNKLTLTLSASREETALSSVLAESVNLTEASKTQHASFTWRILIGSRTRLQFLLSRYVDEMSFRAFAHHDSLVESGSGGLGDAGVDSLAQTDYETLDSRNNRLAIKQTLRHQLAEKNWLNAGLEAVLVDSRIDFRSQQRNFYFARNDIPRDVRFDERQQYYAAYVEDTAELNDRVQLRAGLRFDYATLYDEGDLSHRLSAWYALNERTTLKAAWGEIYQYPDALTLTLRDQPLEIGANREVIGAEKATQKVFGIERQLGDGLTASLEAYHIDIDRLLIAHDRETFEPFNEGRGILEGLEFVVEKKSSRNARVSGLVSYSLGRSRYQDIRTREWTPFNYDRRHALTTWLNYRISKRWSASLLWRYASGLPYTGILGVRFAGGQQGSSYWEFIRTPRNTERFPAYHRLDARLSYHVRSGDRSLSVYLDIINLYNHKNVYNLTWEKGQSPTGGIETEVARRRTIYMLPFLPSIGIQFQL